MDTRMRKLLFALLFLASPVFAQTQTQYYTVPTIAALKAMTTSRPAVVQVVDHLMAEKAEKVETAAMVVAVAVVAVVIR